MILAFHPLIIEAELPSGQFMFVDLLCVKTSP